MQKLALLSIFTLLITGCSRIDTNTAPPGLPEMNIPTVQTQTQVEPAIETVAEPMAQTQQTQPAEPQTAPSIPAIQIPTQQTQDTQTQDTTETQATETESKTQAINLEQSLVEWLGEKIVGASHPGSFNLQSGSLTLKDNKITDGSFVIDINTLKSYQGIGSLEKHLLSADFFDAGQFPTASFDIQSTNYSDDSNFTLTGQLTMKGNTHAETFSATQDNSNKTVTAKLNLDRTKYEIIFGSGKFFKELADAAIKDIIPLEITIKY